MAKDLVEDIKARLSIEEVIGSYLELQQAGSSYKALSPFKQEKTPSFVVTPAKEMWKDFSSGKGGSMFGFVMEYEGVDFREALNILAQKAGLNPNDYRQSAFKSTSDSSQRYKQKALEILKITANFYEKQYQQSRLAQSYVKKRGFLPKIVADFHLGYAPDDWQSLWRYFKTQKISEKIAEATGLIKKRPTPQWLLDQGKEKDKEHWGDFFAGRLMIPLSDTLGNIIGFTGRLLKEEDKGGKYVNSKQTFLYNKSKHVFGYFQAKDTIRQTGYVLVVEGNLDVVACHQAGYKQTVAAGGTALTVDHLKIIGRLTKDVRLAFDGDAAGTAAMERSILAAQQVNINLSIISLPSGLDPDELIKQNLKLWKKSVDNAQPALEWLYEKYKSQLDLTTAVGKKELTNIMLPLINSLRDEVEKDHYLNKIEQDGILRQSLEDKMKAIKGQTVEFPRNTALQNKNDSSKIEEEEKIDLSQSFANSLQKIQLFLGLLLVEPKLRTVLGEKEQQVLLDFLKTYKDEYKLYTKLQKYDFKIEEIKDIPNDMTILKKCIQESLDIIYKTEDGRYKDDEFSIKQNAFNDLWRQFKDLQAKEEARLKIEQL